DAAVWSVLVVPPDPAGQGAGAVAGGGVDEGVCPFPLQDTDERFGFAVGAGRVGLGLDVADAVCGEQGAEAAAAIAGAVIGEHAADGDALLGIGADHGGEKGGAALGVFAWAQLDQAQREWSSTATWACCQ